MILRVFRDGRHEDNYMVKIISACLTAKRNIYIFATGCVGTTPNEVVNSFTYVQHAFGKAMFVPIQVFEITFDEMNQEDALQAAQSFCQLIGYRNQNVATFYECKGIYKAMYIINSISFTDGGCFSDNNHFYIDLAKHALSVLGKQISIELGNNVLFNQ